MKNMICLISDQHVPNLLTVHAVKPDFLILIETKGMKKKNAAENLLKALEIGGLTHFQAEDRHRILSLDDENSIPAAIEVFQNVTSQYPDAQWIVNITGGTKPMSIAAFDFFRSRKDAVIYYVPLNNREALNFSGGSPRKLNHKVTAKEFLAGYGFSFNEGSEITEGMVSEQWYDSSVYLVSNYHNQKIKDFLKNISTLSRKDNRNGRKNGLDIQAADKLKLEDRGFLEHHLEIFPSLKSNGNLISGKLSAPEVCFLTGGWLEVFVWILLSRHLDTLGIWDVRLGLHISKPIQNELDVTFMQNQSLCFIECKTGEQKQDKKGIETLYKVEAIKKQFRALKVNTWLATTSENVIDVNTGKINEGLASRAALYNYHIITGEQLQRIAKKQLEDPSSSELIELIVSEFKLNRGNGS
jgi:hypothetical protein